MIDGATGDVILKDGTRLGRDLTLDAFKASPLHNLLRRGRGSWSLELDLQQGGRFYLCLQFKDDALERIELTMPWDGPPFVAEPAWKAAHDRWIEEILGTAPPVIRDWGRVESVADQLGGSCRILITYR
jgi:hypothetical protein